MRWFGSLILPIIFLIVSIIGLVVKPKMNMFFGYRTKNTMADAKIWQKSNQFFFLFLLISDIVVNIPIMIVMALYILDTLYLVLSCIAVNVVVLICAIIFTEVRINLWLKKHGDEEDLQE